MKNKETPDWFGDLDKENVEKASEIPPQIDLPSVNDLPITVEILSKPFSIDVPSRKDTMLVCKAKRETPEPELNGTMILPKSLRFNIAKAVRQKGGNYEKMDLQGLKIKIWQIIQDGNRYYQCEIMSEI